MRTTLPLGLAVCVLVSGCSGIRPGRVPSEPVSNAAIRVEFEPEDAHIATQVERDARVGVERVESFFGHGFGGPVTIHVLPSREKFDEYAQSHWDFPETQCWMVGAGETAGLILLSPRVWADEACDHDPADTDATRRLVTHELVHTYHMRVNPSNEFDTVTTLDWFVEGLAVYASGQLDTKRKASMAAALKEDQGPQRLADAWSGPNKYGNSGSMVALIDRRWGRAKLTSLLTATSQDELLDSLGVSEQEFLRMWRDTAAW